MKNLKIAVIVVSIFISMPLNGILIYKGETLVGIMLYILQVPLLYAVVKACREKLERGEEL